MFIAAILAIAVITSYTSLALDELFVLPEDANSFEKELAPHEIINRSQWGGRSPVKTEKLSHPVGVVIIAHTASNFCKTTSQCSKLVKIIQDYHLDLGFSDIGYNFLIGGDGNIYEGRGWDVVNNSRFNHSITISFIGNYLYDYLNEDMIDALQELLNDGVDLNKLKDDFKIVCHNQTVPTLSPGNNVYKIIKTLPQFWPGSL